MNPLLQAQNPAVELYELLLQNESIFGRLIHIASLWNPEISRYNRDLPERFQRAGMDHAISKWHQAFFNEWLALSLIQQQSDVTLYWTGMGHSREQIKKIRELGEAAIPPLVGWDERQAFLKNLTFIQAVLNHDANANGTAALSAGHR